MPSDFFVNSTGLNFKILLNAAIKNSFWSDTFSNFNRVRYFGKRKPQSVNQNWILLDGNHGEHWLNGIKVVEYEFATAEFDSLFHLSKYARYPGFEKKRKGHIVITNHTDDSWYRNIKIRKLSNGYAYKNKKF